LASWAIFVGGVIGRLGEDALAGNAAASEFMHLSFMPAIGLNMGSRRWSAVIGRGDYQAAKRRAYLGMAVPVRT